MSQTKEKCESLALSPLLCSVLLFLFRTNGKKGHLDEKDFRHSYGNIFQNWHSESYLITAMLKVPSQQFTTHIENSKILFKDTLQMNNLQIWINVRVKPFSKTSVYVSA